MKVAVFPDYRRDNPYQQLLADALAPLGVSVEHPAGYRRGLPLTRAVRAVRPDVMHLHWPSPYLRSRQPALRAAYCVRTLLDVALVKRMDVAVVWTVHNLVTHDTPTPALERRFSARLAALADHLIVHSEAARDEVIETLRAAPEQITIVPHGSFRPAYGRAPPKATARRALDLRPDGPVALFFGMIRPYKGVPDLLAAWPQVCAQWSDATLLVAGDVRDPQYEVIVRDAARGVPNLKLYLRFIPDEDVPLLMSAADVLVLPFAQSLTSGTVTLAGDYDVPVVVPDVAGARYGARIVVASSTGVRDLSDAIGRVFSGPATINSAAAISASHWGEVATAHRQIYCKVSRRDEGATLCMSN